MKVKLILLAVLILLPIGIRAQTNINIGSYYSTEVGAFGVSFQGMKMLSDGQFQLSVIGSVGEGENSLGFTPGMFLLSGGKVELAVLSGVTTKWAETGGPAYIAGINGLYGTYKLPWCRVFGQWQREWPFDGEGALESTHKFTAGLSLPLP